MIDTDTKEFLLMSIKATVLWRMQLAAAHPNNFRNRHCAEVLRQAAGIVSMLPESHPLFEKLAKVSSIDGEGWAEKESQFFAKWGVHNQLISADCGEAFVRELFGLVDRFLAERC